MSVEEEKSEVLRRSIPIGRIAELASTPESIIWPTDISAHFGGRGVAAEKARRIRASAAKLIDLYDSVLVKPNWRSPENVRTALARLEQIRGAAATKKDDANNEQPATAPWSHGKAVARAEDDAVVSSASGILSEDRRVTDSQE